MFNFFFFFFQAEDGIRDKLVTGVQTCALPISVMLGPKTTSFRQWAGTLAEYAATGGFDGEMAHWAQLDGHADPAIPVQASGPNTVGVMRSVRVSLDTERTTALLAQVPEVYRTQINDVLLTALAATLGRWTGRDQVLITMEGHGREELFEGIDLSRTVGWFTTLFPLALPVTPGRDWGARLRAVKEYLRAIPGGGLGYGALRYLSSSCELSALSPQVSFNYLGQFDWPTPADGPFAGVRGGLAADAAPETTRAHLLDVVGAIDAGRLHLTWFYATTRHQESTVDALAHAMLHALEDIIEHCAHPDAGGRSPSDFPLAHLDQTTVDRIAGNGRTVEDIYPLTPMQAGMVFHGLLDPDSGAYFNQVQLRLSGMTDPWAWGTAWQRVIDRTPMLRSAVQWQGVDEPLQVVHRRLELPIEHHDWRRHSERDREQELARITTAERAAIKLDVPPLLRLVVAQLPDDEVLLVWTVHHVLLDGWSAALVFGEVCEQYAAIVQARTPELVTRRPFRDHLQWLAAQGRDQAEQHWRAVLSGFDSGTPLPYDRPPRQAHRSESTESVDILLGARDTTRLHQVAQRNGLTVNTIVQGAWALLLSRYSGQRDVVFGTTVSGRPAGLSGVESMFGMFVNTVPTR